LKTLRIKNLLPTNALADKLSTRWLPIVKQTPAHKFALAAAGLAVTASAVAGPALAFGSDAQSGPEQASASGAVSGQDARTVSHVAPAGAPVKELAAVAPAGGSASKDADKPKDAGKTADKPKDAGKKSDAPKQDPLAVAKAEEASMPRDKVVGVDYQPQSTFFYCGPAATRIVASAGGHDLSQDDVANKLGTTVNGTPSAVETTRVLNDVFGADTYHTTSVPDRTPDQREADQVQSDVMHTLNQGRAVVANIAGTTTDVTGASHEFDGGHYVAVVGYHDQGGTVLISDPADVNGADSYWISTNNLTQWMATRGYSS
jgi:hypothetical protein